MIGSHVLLSKNRPFGDLHALQNHSTLDKYPSQFCKLHKSQKKSLRYVYLLRIHIVYSFCKVSKSPKEPNIIIMYTY